MDPGVFPEEQLDSYTATSELCTGTGSEVGYDETIL